MQAADTFDWHAWRRAGLGSSDAPVIMDASPWKTPLVLFEEKAGIRPDHSPSSFVQQRGIDMEPEARARYELMSDCDMPPKLVEDPEFPFLRASLDGFNAEAKRVLEIKCPGIEDHATACGDPARNIPGRVPDKYKWQLVHQLMVTGAEEAHYFSYRDKKGVIVVVKRDPKAEAELRQAEIDFWSLVKTGTPPPPTDRDFIKASAIEAPLLVSALRQYAHHKAEAERHAKEMEALKAAAAAEVERLGHLRVRAEGYQIARVSRRGSVDYAKVPELKGLDLEKYRKKPSVFFEIREVAS